MLEKLIGQCNGVRLDIVGQTLWPSPRAVRQRYRSHLLVRNTAFEPAKGEAEEHLPLPSLGEVFHQPSAICSRPSRVNELERIDGPPVADRQQRFRALPAPSNARTRLSHEHLSRYGPDAWRGTARRVRPDRATPILPGPIE